MKNHPETSKANPPRLALLLVDAAKVCCFTERANRAAEWEWHNRFGENYLLRKSIIFRFVTDILYVFLGFVWVNAYFCA